MNRLFKDPLNVIVAGVGGQGNVVVSELIGMVLVRQGFFVTIGETFGASQRGGAVMSHLRISKETQYGSIIPLGGADIVLGMEPVETLRILSKYGNADVVTIVNPRPINPLSVLSGESEYPNINTLIKNIQSLSSKAYVIEATEEAQKMGSLISANVILIGALIALDMLPLDNEAFKGMIRERFPKAIDINLRALEKGEEFILNKTK